MILSLELSSGAGAALLCDENAVPRETVRRAFSPLQNAATRWLELMQMGREVCFRLAIEPKNLALVVLAFDGNITPDATVMRTPFSLGFEGYNLRRGLEEHLGATQILVCRALHARALGEEKYGVAQGEDDWIWLQLGPRLESFATKNGVQFETRIEALVLDRDGPLDELGRRGTLGAFCGGDSFGARCASYGLTVAPTLIFEMVSFNLAAQSLVDDFLARLAQGIGGASAVLGAKTVVLGGEFGRAIWPQIALPLAPRVRDFMGGNAPRLCVSSLGEEGTVLGAVALGFARNAVLTTPR